jgi:death-on-curing protein
VHLKAAALLQILVRLPALEHSSEAFARHSCKAYVALNGHHLTRQPEDAVALVRDASAAAIGVARTARPLRARFAP